MRPTALALKEGFRGENRKTGADLVRIMFRKI